MFVVDYRSEILSSSVSILTYVCVREAAMITTAISVFFPLNNPHRSRGKQSEEPAEESCYQCHLPERQVGDLNVIPVQVTAEVAKLLMHKQ